MKAFFIICLLLQVLALQSQQETVNNHTFKTGLTFSWAPVSYILKLLDVESEARINGKDFYSAGITGIYSFNKNLAIETGVVFSKYAIHVVPWGPDRSGYMQNVSILYIPVALRSSFLKYLYATGGFIFEFDLGDHTELRKQTGIGILIGPGFNYDFSNGFSVFVNPYLNVHSVISFTNGLANDKIIEASIRLGLLYRL